MGVNQMYSANTDYLEFKYILPHDKMYLNTFGINWYRKKYLRSVLCRYLPSTFCLHPNKTAQLKFVNSAQTMEQNALKNVNICLSTNIYFYLQTSDGQSSNLYLNAVHFFNTSVNETSVAA